MIIKLRPHHISNIAQSYYTNFSKFDWLMEEYGELFKNYYGMINAAVIYNRSCKIMVVRGLDDVCQNPYVTCPLREKYCETKFAPRDNICKDLYGLEIGTIYSSAEIIAIFHKFKNQSSYNFPEEWMKDTFLGEETKLLE